MVRGTISIVVDTIQMIILATFMYVLVLIQMVPPTFTIFYFLIRVKYTVHYLLS